MQLREILKDIQPLNITGDVEKEINNIVFNSKLASPNSLFVALKGAQHDGISYVSEAISKGAVAILAQEYPVPRHNGITYIQAS
ncbi:MAG: UDP-N-acetylmuramoyl-L-alanyl-D-glutamate--2,6-diaminopimelate ligase, partial [Thermodesulfobacteriota bacterium]